MTFKIVYTNQQEAFTLPDSKKHETVLEFGRGRGAWARSGSNQGQEFTDRIKEKARRAGGAAGHALSIQRGEASAGSSVNDVRQTSIMEHAWSRHPKATGATTRLWWPWRMRVAIFSSQIPHGSSPSLAAFH